MNVRGDKWMAGGLLILNDGKDEVDRDGKTDGIYGVWEGSFQSGGSKRAD